jgi:hypothetical protein
MGFRVLVVGRAGIGDYTPLGAWTPPLCIASPT